MTRVGWGRAFAFAGLAVGAPWLVVDLIATALWAFSADDSGREIIVVARGIAAVSMILCAVLVKIRAPRTRTAAVVRAWLACAIGVFLVPFAMLIPSGEWEIGLIVAMFAEMIFFVGGGAPWVAGGALAASRILRVERTLGPHWIPLGWLAIGILVAACAVAITLTAGPPRDMMPYETFAPSPERGAWNWLPLGWEWSWGASRETPGWIPTFVLASGLGLVAVGAGLWIGRRGPQPRS